MRETLELTEGDPSVLQLGGFHGDVKKNEQKKAGGYESHHIPAQSVFSVCADELPAIALTKEDHKKTDSYAGKQGHRFKPILPGVQEQGTYKEEVISDIDGGAPGFISVVRAEIYNIKDQFGSKYDGALGQYLDALSEYIAKNGIPKTKHKK